MRLTQEEVEQRIKSTFKQKIEITTTYINKRSDIGLKCLECGHEWSTTAQNVMYLSKEQQLHTCPACTNTLIECECAYCGKKIKRRPSEIKKNESGFFYCSVECGNLHKNQIRKESGEWDNSTNYRMRAMEHYEHHCVVCGWKEDPRILEVHHIDENRSHNTLDNLCLLCPICHRKITLGYYTLITEPIWTLVKKI